MENNNEEQKLTQVWLDIAEQLLYAGAEISRVEDTLKYLASCHNVQKIDAFTITAGILVSCTFNSGNTLTQTRRVVKAPSMDVSRIEKLNALSRKASAERLSADDLKTHLDKIISEESSRIAIFGGALAAAAFSFFFGGSPLDSVVSGFFGSLICLFSRKAGRYFPNPIFYNFVVSLMAGVLISLMSRLFPGLHIDKIIIGDVMLLVPGLSITVAMRDMLAGDTISGLLRFVESIIWTGGLSAGFLAAILITGGVL